MNVCKENKKKFVMREKLFFHKDLNGLYKVLVNLCNLLKAEKHLDHCYCNLTYSQCWMCNFANYVIENKVLERLLVRKRCKDHVFETTYKLLFYIKKIRNDGLEGEDRKWVLDFFKRKFKPA